MAYKVTDTREVSVMSPAGNRQVSYRVWITTDKGSSGSVDVLKEEWEAGALRAILDEKAEQLDLAFSLTE